MKGFRVKSLPYIYLTDEGGIRLIGNDAKRGMVQVPGNRRGRLLRALYRDRYLYMLLLPVVAYYVIFKYLPLYGLQIAFRDFKLGTGITGGEWVGLKYFNRLFSSSIFSRVVRNTLRLNIYNLIFGFPIPIILALMFNEMKNARYKKVSQSLIYIPHFFSWVVLGGMVINILSPSTGVVNTVYKAISGNEKGIYFMADPGWWQVAFVGSGIWKEAGWGTIIYLAAISGVDPQLYEAAIIDGANKRQQIMNITLPTIRPTIAIMLILRMGSMMDVGLEQVMMLQNDLVMEVADVISTYVYRQGVQKNQYSLTTALGIFQSAITAFLLLSTNWASKRFTESSIW